MRTVLLTYVLVVCLPRIFASLSAPQQQGAIRPAVFYGEPLMGSRKLRKSQPEGHTAWQSLHPTRLGNNQELFRGSMSGCEAVVFDAGHEIRESGADPIKQ